jgi:hypothetical protein
MSKNARASNHARSRVTDRIGRTPPPRRRVLSAALWLGCCLALATGCESTGSTASHGPTTRNQAIFNPNAERLHEISGALLLYQARHGTLPPSLDELKADVIASGNAALLPPLVCPVTKKPYVYHAAGLIAPGVPGRIILHGPEPIDGRYWALIVGQASSGGNSGGGGATVAVPVLLSPEQLRSARPAPPPAAPPGP